MTQVMKLIPQIQLRHIQRVLEINSSKPFKYKDKPGVIIYFGNEYETGLYRTNREGLYVLCLRRFTPILWEHVKTIFFTQAIISEISHQYLSPIMRNIRDEFRLIYQVYDEMPVYSNLDDPDDPTRCCEPAVLPEGESVFNALPLDKHSYIGPISAITKI